MIRVVGNEIEFDGMRVGALQGAWPTLQERVRAALESWDPDGEQKAAAAAYEHGYEEARTYASDEIDSLVTQVNALRAHVVVLEKEIKNLKRRK